MRKKPAIPPTRNHTRNSLSHDRYMDLCLAIEPMAEELRGSPPVFAKLSKALTKKLGFSVSSSSLSKACKRYGIEPRNKVGKLIRIPSIQRFDNLEERVAALEEKVMLLQSVLTGLTPTPKPTPRKAARSPKRSSR